MPSAASETGVNPLPEREHATSLSAQAYRIILKRILQGRIPIGGELSRRKLSAELGMSILPVSEALARLQDEGIAESQPRVGTRVRRPTALDVRELYEMREALECQTARLFSRAATARDRESLMEMALRVDELYNGLPQAGNDPDYRYTVMEHHARFHLRIAEVGKCFALYTALEKNQVLSFCWLYYNAAHRPAPPPHFHSEFVNELCSGDEEAADKAMREHVRHGVTEFARATMLEPVPVRQPVIPPLRQEFP